MGGSFVWESASLVLDPSGDIVVTGTFERTKDFDPGPGIYNLSSASNSIDIFLSKFDADGNFKWAKQIGGTNTESGNAVTTDVLGNIYLTGWFQGEVDFDPGPAINNLVCYGDMDMFILKSDPNGNFIWAKQVGGAGASPLGEPISISGNAIAADGIGGLYTTGFFKKLTDFDPGPAISALLPMGRSDIFIHKMFRCISASYSSMNAIACSKYTLNGQTYSSSGSYQQTLTNAIGCDSILTLNLDIKPPVSSIANVAICPGENYLGHTTAETYADTLQTANGCDSLRITNIIIKNNCLPFAIPNAFTPNNDGKNDIFRPVIHEVIQDYRFTIFNRYGEKVFETTDYRAGWDGTFKGKKQPNGSYIYYIKLKSNTGQVAENSGTVLVIR